MPLDDCRDGGGGRENWYVCDSTMGGNEAGTDIEEDDDCTLRADPAGGVWYELSYPLPSPPLLSLLAYALALALELLPYALACVGVTIRSRWSCSIGEGIVEDCNCGCVISM